jgi:cytochrome c oxidase subunit 4
MSDHVVPLSTYRKVFVWLFVLLIITVGAAFVNFGTPKINIAVAMAIAITKMTLIILFFMHVKYSSKLTMVFAASGFLWMVIMLAFFVSDVAARPVVPDPWTDNEPPAVQAETPGTHTPEAHAPEAAHH